MEIKRYVDVLVLIKRIELRFLDILSGMKDITKFHPLIEPEKSCGILDGVMSIPAW